jgi:Fur family peroxide stress response transcriptional regulator
MMPGHRQEVFDNSPEDAYLKSNFFSLDHSVIMEQTNTLLAAFETACKKAGLKITHQRLEIYREILSAEDHPTAEMLYLRLREKLPTISIDTIYRTLTTFAGHGLVSKVETSENLSRFEVARTPHHHLICSTCNTIADFTWPHLDQLPLPQEASKWGQITTTTIVVYGICNKCLSAEHHRVFRK